MIKLPKPGRVISKPICKLYTARLGYRESDKLILDTTIKSGKGLGKLLAPTWELVMPSRRGQITWDEYIAGYTQLMQDRFKAAPEAYNSLFARPSIVLCCYCQDTSHTTRHCHRYLIRDIFAPLVNVTLIDAGELFNPVYTKD